MGHLSKGKKKRRTREVSGKGGRGNRVKEVVDDGERDRMTQEEGWVPWGGAGNRTELVSCNL